MADGWDTPTIDSGLGVHYADLATSGLAPGDTLPFTFYWPGASRWEGVDFSVRVIAEDAFASGAHDPARARSYPSPAAGGAVISQT